MQHRAIAKVAFGVFYQFLCNTWAFIVYLVTLQYDTKYLICTKI